MLLQKWNSEISDQNPFVFNIEDYTVQNETYRTSIWTGTYMQLTVMSIPAGIDIGEENAS